MKVSTTAAVLATALALAAAPTTGRAATDQTLERAKKPKVTVTLPNSLVEGDRLIVKVKVGRTQEAKRILLQRFTTDIFGNTSWETVKKAKVAGKKRHTFGAVAGEGDTERYRARVLYADAKPAMSKPASATVWHWSALTDMPDYYKTVGIFESASGPINGVQYNGVFTYGSSYSSWEIRYTLGRHCRALRGVLGVGDNSADGSSAVISLVQDETHAILTSATLTPGMDQRFQVDLALPYRLSVQMQETSPADEAAYPAIGTPELLCTGQK